MDNMCYEVKKTTRIDRHWRGSRQGFNARCVSTGGTFLTSRLQTDQHRVRWYGAEAFLTSQQILINSKNSSHFMQPEDSLPHWQQPATCPYPEPDRSSPCLPCHFCKIRFNIILPSRPSQRDRAVGNSATQTRRSVLCLHSTRRHL